MGGQELRPEAANGGEAEARAVRLRDTLEEKRVARRRLFWGGLIPGIAATAYFVGTSFTMESQAPALTLAVLFGGASAMAWRRLRRIRDEEQGLEDGVGQLDASDSDSS